MMMRRRRRPLLRTAALAGGGAALYHAGKSHEANADHEATQDAAIEQNAQQPAQAMPAAPAPTGGGGLSDDAMARLKELGQLHEQGVLTDEEFTSQKNAILAS